jgi:hypothetical protein
VNPILGFSGVHSQNVKCCISKPNKNSFPSPDDDTNFDDAPPQDFEHFQKFQITSCSSFHIYLHIILLVCSNSFRASEPSCQKALEFCHYFAQTFSGSLFHPRVKFIIFTKLILH